MTRWLRWKPLNKRRGAGGAGRSHPDLANGNIDLAKFGAIDQIGILVDDLDASINRWISHSGVGPWTLFRNVALDGQYRGEPTRVTMHVGLSYQDGVQIELIEATNDAPSPYRADDGSRLLGLHHIARIVDDLDAAVETAVAGGMEVLFTAHNPARASPICASSASLGHYSNLSAVPTCVACVKQGSRRPATGTAAIL